MNIYELYTYIEGAMKADGKSFHALANLLQESRCDDIAKARMLYNCVASKYLPEGFDGKIDRMSHGKGKYILICYNESLYDYVYINIFGSFWDAKSEMERQYNKRASEYHTDDKGIHNDSAYIIDDNCDATLSWRIIDLGIPLKTDTYDRLIGDREVSK